MLLLLLGCSPGDGASGGVVAALRVEPLTDTLSTSPGAPATLQFTAYATFEGGEEEPLDLVSWSTSNVSAGTISSVGAFVSADTNGGVTTITAGHQELTATAELRVVYTDHYVVDVDEAVVAAFAAASPTDDSALALTYPADGVTVPRNVDGFAFAWPETSAVTRLHFEGDITDVSVYTAGSRWSSTAELWQIIAASNREGSVQVTLEQGTWAGGALTDVRRGTPIQLAVHRLDARGSLLYWQTRDSAIMRIPFGETTATRFWPPEGDTTCYGCHVVSEPTSTMPVSSSGNQLSIIDVSDVSAPVLAQGPADDRRASLKTVSPDGRYMIAAIDGTLRLHSLPDGAPIKTLDTGSYMVTHPEWSPDGTKVAMVRATGNWLSEMQFYGGELVVAPWDGKELGYPTVLVARSETNAYYPAFSPDGEWIAFNRSTGDAYANDDAELWLVRPDGSDLIRLDNANGSGALRNSFPRWAPLPDDNVLWLAFSSKRPYPVEDNAELPQIWVSAIDTELADQGLDPSHAAFWLPGQDVTSDNHLPVWWSR